MNEKSCSVFTDKLNEIDRVRYCSMCVRDGDHHLKIANCTSSVQPSVIRRTPQDVPYENKVLTLFIFDYVVQVSGLSGCVCVVSPYSSSVHYILDSNDISFNYRRSDCPIFVHAYLLYYLAYTNAKIYYC